MLSTATKIAGKVTEASAEHDLKSTANSAIQSAHDVIDRATDSLSDYADDVRGKVRGLSNQARTATDRLSGQVRDNPLPSSLVILGVGVVLGLLLNSSHRRGY